MGRVWQGGARRAHRAPEKQGDLPERQKGGDDTGRAALPTTRGRRSEKDASPKVSVAPALPNPTWNCAHMILEKLGRPGRIRQEPATRPPHGASCSQVRLPGAHLLSTPSIRIELPRQLVCRPVFRLSSDRAEHHSRRPIQRIPKARPTSARRLNAGRSGSLVPAG